MGRRFGSRDSV